MNTASAKQTIGWVAALLTISFMLMAGVGRGHAGSPANATTPGGDSHHTGKEHFLAQLKQLRADLGKGDQDRINADLTTLFEIIGEMPNTEAGRHEAQKLSEKLWKTIRAQEERAALSY